MLRAVKIACCAVECVKCNQNGLRLFIVPFRMEVNCYNKFRHIVIFWIAKDGNNYDWTLKSVETFYFCFAFLVFCESKYAVKEKKQMEKLLLIITKVMKAFALIPFLQMHAIRMDLMWLKLERWFCLLVMSEGFKCQSKSMYRMPLGKTEHCFCFRSKKERRGAQETYIFCVRDLRSDLTILFQRFEKKINLCQQIHLLLFLFRLHFCANAQIAALYHRSLLAFAFIRNWYKCLGNRSCRVNTSSMTTRLREQRIIQHLIYRIYRTESQSHLCRIYGI